MLSFPALTPQMPRNLGITSRQTRTQASRFSFCPSSPLKGNSGVQALSLSTFPEHGDEPGGQAHPILSPGWLGIVWPQDAC